MSSEFPFENELMTQGLTLDLAKLDISQCFAEGQAYVALSRVRTLSGLSLKAFKATSVCHGL